MSFPVFGFLSLSLSLFLPSFALPVASPPISGGHSQAYIGGNFDRGASTTTVVAETAPLTHGAQLPPPSPGSPVLFLPQDPSADAFTELDSESSVVASVSPDSDPAMVHPNITQDPSSPSTPLMMAYYPAWVANTFPPERINFSLFDWIDFAFAVPNANYTLDWDGSDMAPDILTRLVDLAHQRGTKVKLSIGGWGGSKWFSPTLASDINRQTFVGNIAEAYDQYHLDGIDIDWEYPGEPGDPRNYVDSNDTANFLEFLRLLRTTLPSTARITAAVQTTPFTDANRQPMDYVKPFADVLDWVLIMNYDTWGSSSNPGSNAPLDDACQNSTLPAANAAAAINAWTAAGFSASQLALGVPSYGYISLSNATHLRQRDQNASSPYVQAATEEGKNSGSVQFRGLVDQGVLCGDPSGYWPGGYLGCGGFTREWDACSSTPFLRSDFVDQVITYDDAQSLGLKSALAKERKLIGVNMFDLHGDTNEWDLVDSVRQGLGL